MQLHCSLDLYPVVMLEHEALDLVWFLRLLLVVAPHKANDPLSSCVL